MPDPFRTSPELSGGAFLDQVEVASELAPGFDVDVDAVEVGLDKGDEAGEAAAVGGGVL